MKKLYTKPQIVFESFIMSTSIAGNCEAPFVNATKGICAVTGSGGLAIFDGSVNACNATPEEMGGIADHWDGLCYHVPTEAANLFNS